MAVPYKNFNMFHIRSKYMYECNQIYSKSFNEMQLIFVKSGYKLCKLQH